MRINNTYFYKHVSSLRVSFIKELACSVIVHKFSDYAVATFEPIH